MKWKRESEKMNPERQPENSFHAQTRLVLTVWISQIRTKHANRPTIDEENHSPTVLFILDA